MILYHVAGLEKLVWASLEERGLGDVLERGAVTSGAGFTVRGQRGGVFCATPFSPDAVAGVAWQSLRDITGRPEHEDVSIGTLGTVTEAWLRRRRFYGGKPLDLVNGLRLSVPVLSALPGVLTMRQGVLQTTVQDERALAAMVMVTDAMMGAKGGKFSINTFPFAAAVLSINYRVTWAELTLLRCLQEDDARRIFNLAMDQDGQEATERGRNPTAPSSDAG